MRGVQHTRVMGSQHYMKRELYMEGKSKVEKYWSARVAEAIEKTGLADGDGEAAFRALLLEQGAAILAELDSLTAIHRDLAKSYATMAQAYSDKKGAR